MASDPTLQARAHDFLVAADRHNWSYQWSWLGLPVIQIPTDIVALQELIWRARPQLIIETGVARGGSLAVSASVLQLIGEGHVIGIDIDIRQHNRLAIESHPLAGRITLIEGSSVEDSVVEEVARKAAGVERVMVILDSNHTHEHVAAELKRYSGLVSVGQYLVVCDTVVEDLPQQSHRPRSWGKGDNPATAVRGFLSRSDEFEIDVEIQNKLLISSSPNGYLRRRSAAST